MTRHPDNSNLLLYYDPYFEGIPVQTQRGPLVTGYLQRTKQVFDLALQEHPRVFAFRVDLGFPAGYQGDMTSNQVLERFIASFRAKIRHNRERALEAAPYAHDTSLRYVWCRELGQQGVPHYHAAFLLNGDAFYTLGQYEIGRSNLFNRLHEAWASALGLPVECVPGLVRLPENPIYRLHRGDPASTASFFYRVSYLCKADTKQYGTGAHGFGASRQ